MVAVRVYVGEDGSLNLRMGGHAGAGAWGRDLVCAGCSTLAYGLGKAAAYLEAAGMLTEPARVELEPGKASVTVQPRAAFRQAAALVFWTVQVGIHELAASFPDNVELKETIRLEGGEKHA